VIDGVSNLLLSRKYKAVFRKSKIAYVCPECFYESKEPGVCPNCKVPLVASCPVCGNPMVGEHIHLGG